MKQTQLLIIEQNKSVARIQKHLAQKAGYTVDVAENLAQAQTFLNMPTRDYFACVADFVLADAPNGEAIDTSIAAGIPTIAITALMSAEIRAEILRRPVVDYILKENKQAFEYLHKLLVQLRLNQTIKVLVADDSTTSREHITNLLTRHYFKVVQAENGQAAVECFEENPDIKIIVTDYEMPIMDGLALTSQLRLEQSAEELVIIGISSADKEALSARFIKNGANDYIRKPFCAEEFYCRLFQNITYLNNVETIRKQANTDYLTGLPNRRYFFHRAKQYCEQFNGDSSYELYLAIMDIDHFKSVNDTYGHDAGDKVLQITAQLLNRHFGEENLARFGGEEFCILFEKDQLGDIPERLEAFREALEKTRINLDDDSLSVTISIGLAGAEQKDINRLISDADQKLYRAKEKGRNQLIY